MRKILVMMLAVAALLVMAACDADKPGQENTIPDNVTQAPDQTEQENVPPSSEPQTVRDSVIGVWKLVVTMPGNVSSTQILEFKEDGTAVYQSIEKSADGTVKEDDPIIYQWTLEDGVVTCVGKKHTIYYLFDGAANTLTDKHHIGSVFTPVN